MRSITLFWSFRGYDLVTFFLISIEEKQKPRLLLIPRIKILGKKSKKEKKKNTKLIMLISEHVENTVIVKSS